MGKKLALQKMAQIEPVIEAKIQGWRGIQV
jgi:hypothetical protein